MTTVLFLVVSAVTTTASTLFIFVFPTSWRLSMDCKRSHWCDLWLHGCVASTSDGTFGRVKEHICAMASPSVCDVRFSARSFWIDTAAEGANTGQEKTSELDPPTSEPVSSVIILLCAMYLLVGCLAVKMVARRRSRAREQERALIGDDGDDTVSSSLVDRSRLAGEAGGDDEDGLDAGGDQATAGSVDIHVAGDTVNAVGAYQGGGGGYSTGDNDAAYSSDEEEEGAINEDDDNRADEDDAAYSPDEEEPDEGEDEAAILGSAEITASTYPEAELATIHHAGTTGSPGKDVVDSTRRLLLHHYKEILFTSVDRLGRVAALVTAALGRRVEDPVAAKSALRCVGDMLSCVAPVDWIRAIFMNQAGELFAATLDCLSSVDVGMVHEAEQAMSTELRDGTVVFLLRVIPSLCYTAVDRRLVRSACMYTDVFLKRHLQSQKPGTGLGKRVSASGLLLAMRAGFHASMGDDVNEAAARVMIRCRKAISRLNFEKALVQSIGKIDAKETFERLGPWLDHIDDSKESAPQETYVRGDGVGGGAVGESARAGCMVRERDADSFSTESLSRASFRSWGFLGSGAFGSVNLATKAAGSQAGRAFALKSFGKKTVAEKGLIRLVEAEVKALRHLRHPFVLRLYGTFRDQNRVYLITELLSGGDLSNVIHRRSSGYDPGCLPSDHVRFYVAMVVDAIGFMHSKGIAHRDVKPANLMMDEKGYLRVADLGYAKAIPCPSIERASTDGLSDLTPRSFTKLGSPRYMAPEILTGEGHTRSVDLWAIGVVLFEMVTGSYSLKYRKYSFASSVSTTGEMDVLFPDEFDQKAGGPQCKELISQLLVVDPERRLGYEGASLAGVKGHAMFKGLDWNRLRAKGYEPPWVPGGVPSPRLPTDAEQEQLDEEYEDDDQTFFGGF